MKGLRFLYSGKNGQLGLCFAELAEYAKNKNVELIGLGREQLDITNHSQIIHILDFFKPDIFFNFAAYTQVDLAESEPDKAKQVNSEGPSFLALECAKRNIPLVHISTDYVFDGAKDEPYDTTDETSPINIYGKTKLEGERGIIKNTNEYLIIRTSWVFSRYGQNFLKTMVKMGREKEELSIVNDQMGGPTYAPHLAMFILDLALNVFEKKKGWGIYHFAGHPFVSWYEFAREIFKNVHGKTPILKEVSSAYYKTKAQRPKNSCLKSNHTFLRNDWNEGIRDVLKR